MSMPRIRRRSLHLETLERRSVLAGNVVATVLGNTLSITGDGLDNQVAVVQLAPQRYTVLGINTTVNGAGKFQFTPNRDVSHVTANLGGGDDALGLTNNALALGDLAQVAFNIDLEAVLGVMLADLQAQIDAATPINDFSLRGNLNVNAGGGDDMVGVIGHIGGSIVANLGPGSGAPGGFNAFGLDGNSLVGGKALVGGLISIIGGAQPDGAAIYDATVRSSVSATLGEGLGNGLEVAGSTIGGNVVATAGGGDDQLFVDDSTIQFGLSATLGKGDNAVGVANSLLGLATIITGEHDDDVRFFNSEVRYNLVVNTGGGEDFFGADGLDVGFNATLNTGAGDDTVNITASSVGYWVTILLQGGDDELTITDSTALGARLYGDAGNFDVLNVDNATLAAVDFWFRNGFEDENIVI